MGVIWIIIGRIGWVDGVALETEKRIAVLQKMWHKIFLLSWEYEENVIDPARQELLPQLSFHSPTCIWEQEKAFFHPDKDVWELLEHLEKTSNEISEFIINRIDENNIDTIISENASAYACHLSMWMWIKKVVEKTWIKIITHDHDFHRERGDRFISPHADINQIVEETFPLQLPDIKHAVINTNAQQTLTQKYNINNSTVVPNVMNFDQEFGQITDDNKYLPKYLWLNNDDIPIFQITRIVKRKWIETAIEMLYRLQDPRLKLIITWTKRDDEESGYYNFLIEMIHKYKLLNQVIFAENIVHAHRLKDEETWIKNYSLGDAYAHARACTYFSTYEWFGNAFLEAVLAKKPIFVNNYKPVYRPDIGSKWFKTVMLEDNILTDEKLEEIKNIIYNPQLAEEIGEYNLQLWKRYFSFDILEEKLTELLR